MGDDGYDGVDCFVDCGGVVGGYEGGLDCCAAGDEFGGVVGYWEYNRWCGEGGL